ncbi:MAG: branched-chain amino acid ABC transporter permease [Alcaligenaceae bacterium]|nr:branched-chain amino acid ABC transporter permease [Alcaligenaceae bacterium]
MADLDHTKDLLDLTSHDGGKHIAVSTTHRVSPFSPFWVGAVLFLACMFALTLVVPGLYVLFVGYVVLQFIVLATGWNILGGYAGYLNFGAAAYFATGAYTTVALFQLTGGLPLPLLLVAAGIMGALLGFMVGVMSIRLRGIYFSIATLAIAIILETAVLNWDYVGGARGISMFPDGTPWPFHSYTQWLFVVMSVLVVLAIAAARYVERSFVGRGLQALRDDEAAAECAGVPTLKLKLAASSLSGAIMAVAGAPFVFYMSFIEPHSAFTLNYSLAAIAMPIIGGMSRWIGPVIGAVLLGTLQQIIAVRLSGEWNILVTGLVLMGFVIAAPSGIVGLLTRKHARKG